MRMPRFASHPLQLPWQSWQGAALRAAFSFARHAGLATLFAALTLTLTLAPPVAGQAPVSEKSAAPTSGKAAAAANTANPPAAPATPAAPTPVAVTKIFVTIGDRPSVMFDAPSIKANKLFIVNPYTPLEMLVKLDKLTKVRDVDGTVGWVENTTLGERRHVQVSTTTADIRASATANSALVFDAQRSVALEVNGAAIDGWLPVKHRDGQSGFVRLSQIWGD